MQKDPSTVEVASCLLNASSNFPSSTSRFCTPALFFTDKLKTIRGSRNELSADRNAMKALSLTLIAFFGVVSAHADTVHARKITIHSGHATVHTGSNYHRNYRGGYYAGHRSYANANHGGRYWHGGYYHGHYYDGGYYPYDAPFFVGLPIPFPVPFSE
jgi:hypothetical protein